jgi:Mg2+ and Co2+ transporter CorA
LSFDVVRILGNKFNLHRLAVEDLLHTKTRTKVDWYAEHAFIVLTLQRLVRLHQHTGKGEKCGCDEGLSREDCKDINEKFESHSQRRRGTGLRSLMNWFLPRDNQPEGLPRYLDRNRDGKMDEFVNAHSGLSEDAPIMPIRTLHRYESAQIPSHTAWMEQHSALAQEDLTVSVEQVSIFLLSDNSVISFFEQSADAVEFPILERLHSKETMLRRSCDASLLTQAIIDTIVDLAVPVKEAYNKSRKELQIDAMTNPDIRTSRALHIFGEEIDMLQNLFKPIVHLVNSLRDHNNEGPATVSNGAPPPMSSTPPDGEPELKPNVNRRNREGTPVATRSYSEFRMKALSKSANATSVTITPLAHTYFGDVLDHCKSSFGLSLNTNRKIDPQSRYHDDQRARANGRVREQHLDAHLQHGRSPDQ